MCKTGDILVRVVSQLNRLIIGKHILMKCRIFWQYYYTCFKNPWIPCFSSKKQPAEQSVIRYFTLNIIFTNVIIIIIIVSIIIIILSIIYILIITMDYY